MKNTQKEKIKIGNLAKELGIQKFVVRFWEKEFGICASRTKGGQRFYKKKDFEQFKKIKKLLYEQGFTIAGAKKILDEGKNNKTEVTLLEKVVAPETALITTSTSTTPHTNTSLDIDSLKTIQQHLRDLKDKLQAK